MLFTRETWDDNSYKELLEYLKSLEDTKYKEFHRGLVPGLNNFIGVRTPQLRIIAKEIAKGNFKEFMEISKGDCYEEIMIEGMVIGNIKCDFENIEEYIEAFIPKIKNWAVCDSFCSGLKITKKSKKEMIDLVRKNIYSENPWSVRFSTVMLLNYYIEEEYLEEVFAHCDNIKSEEYYVKMAVSWLISMAFIKHEEETFEYIRKNKLDDFTHNKAIQKILESNRVSKETKEVVRALKRKKVKRAVE